MDQIGLGKRQNDKEIKNDYIVIIERILKSNLSFSLNMRPFQVAEFGKIYQEHLFRLLRCWS